MIPGTELLRNAFIQRFCDLFISMQKDEVEPRNRAEAVIDHSSSRMS